MASEETIEVREISPPESITSQEVVCHCPDKPLAPNVPSQDRRDYFLCCRCARLQHEKCYYPDRNPEVGFMQFRCIPCKAAAYEEAKQEAEKQRERRRIYEEESKREYQHEQKELRESITPLLWRHYCLLPDSDATTTAVKKACELKFEDGRMVPTQPPPASWAKAVDSNLKIMMGACGKSLTDVIRGPGFWKKEMMMRILPPLQKIATKLIYHGAWKGQRKNLGVLGEVLGLEMKGTVWKGEVAGT